MRASADIIWRTFQTFSENDELDSLASEEEDEEISSEDFESGEEEGEGTDSRTQSRTEYDRVVRESLMKVWMLIMLNS